jgi:hypothetical protein
MMNKPQIATILENGEYGQRDMTDDEIAIHEELTNNAPQSLVPDSPIG